MLDRPATVSVTRPPFEHHVMPSGAECFYRDSDHSYFAEVHNKSGKWTGVQSSRLANPSSVGAVLDIQKADRLMQWAARHPDAIGHRDKRAREGTNVHRKVFEALAGGGTPPSLSDVEEDERGYARAVISWWADRNPKAIASEFVVVSLEHGYAGRVDLLCEIQGLRLIVDLKTSKWIGESAHAQLAGYELAAEESGFGPIDGTLILHARPDGRYSEWGGLATPEQFAKAVDIFRESKSLGAAIREQQREAGA